MRLPSPSRLFLPALLISSHHHFGLAAPVPVYHDERDLSSAVGNLLDDFSDLVNDTASLLSQFVAVIKEVKNATNENDLVGLLGVNVTSSDKDDDDNVATGANGTVSAVAANGTVTCPDMAVLFARGTAELGKSTVSLSYKCSPARWRHLPSGSVTDELPHQETSVYIPAHHSSQHYATTSTGHQQWPSRASHTQPPSPAS